MLFVYRTPKILFFGGRQGFLPKLHSSSVKLLCYHRIELSIINLRSSDS